ncbi:MAG: DNA polymerase [Gammaproteobacteria bacterium]|nr:DNA polymerase [Gammaproteobacteria bacterium]
MISEWTCDIETDGLDPTVVWCIVAQHIITKEIVTFEPTQVRLFNGWLESVDRIVFHNGIGFDVPVLEKLLGTDFTNVLVEDTLILSQLTEPRREGGHSLASWGERFGFPKGDYEDWSHYTTEMLEYCTRDVEITTKLYGSLNLKGYSRDAIDLEYKIRRYCSEQEKYGWYFNQRKAYEVLQDVSEGLRKVEFEVQTSFPPLPVWKTATKLNKKFKTDGTRTLAYTKQVKLQCHTNSDGEYGYYDYPQLNLGSRQQVAHHLMHYGWKPTVFTETGKPKVDESTLEDVLIPEAKLISRYLMLQKRKSQLDRWIEEYNPVTKSIHARVHTIGTVTHRMSSSNPNLQQVTASNKEFGADMRSLFTVRPGKVLVGADLSGLELRCLAHYMKDPDYTKEILEGDIHTKNQESAGLSTRSEAKRFIYAYLYGGGDSLIGKIVGGDIKEGKDIKKKFLDNTPALRELRTRVEKSASKGYLDAIDKRRIKVRSPHSALNFLLQSAGSIIAKRAWVIFHENCSLPYRQLGVIHDEIQLECAPEHADMIGTKVVQAMEATTQYYNLRCPITGEYKIGKSWHETH